MTAAQQRKALRVLHLIAAAALVGALVFLPELNLRYAVSLVILALLALTGGAMWQVPRLRRLWKAFTQGDHVQVVKPPHHESAAPARSTADE